MLTRYILIFGGVWWCTYVFSDAWGEHVFMCCTCVYGASVHTNVFGVHVCVNGAYICICNWWCM